MNFLPITILDERKVLPCLLLCVSLSIYVFIDVIKRPVQLRHEMKANFNLDFHPSHSWHTKKEAAIFETEIPPGFNFLFEYDSLKRSKKFYLMKAVDIRCQAQGFFIRLADTVLEKN